MKGINIYSSPAPHEAARIYGTRVELERLREYLTLALDAHVSRITTFDSAGEGYDIQIHVVGEGEFSAAPPPWKDWWKKEPPNMHAPNIGAENDGVDESEARSAAPVSCGDCGHVDQTNWAEPSAICRHPDTKSKDFLDPDEKPKWCPLGAKCLSF